MKTPHAEFDLDLEFAKHIELCSYEELLGRLIAEDKDDKAVEEWPVVRVAIGAQTYVGSPVKMDALGADTWLALLDTEKEEISLLNVRQICGLTLLAPQRHASTFTARGEWNVATDNAPTGLEIERRLDSVGKAVKSLPGLQVVLEGRVKEASPAARKLIGNVAQALQGVLTQIASDKIGLEALRSCAKVVLVFAPESTLEVERGKSQIRIMFGFKMNAKDMAKTLQTQIENIL